jgi:hypothetical protein
MKDCLVAPAPLAQDRWGFAVRQLYADQDEVLFDAARPIILSTASRISSPVRI